MKLPGHLPAIEGHIVKAVNAIQRLPEKDREALQPVFASLKALTLEQGVFNRKVHDALSELVTTVDLEVSNSSDSSLMLALMFGGG